MTRQQHTAISDEIVWAFEAEYLAVLYPDRHDFTLSPPGSAHFEGYRAGLTVALAKLRGET